MMFDNLLANLSRRKTIVNSALQDTKLKRCLGIFDLVGLGVGSSLGVGIYVVTSYAIGSEAGPSYVISVILAGVATLLAGLCYAEFSSRLPRCGSAYLYTYATLGEFCGFVIGWNMLLEHVVTAAIAAKAWSHYLDFMTNGTISRSISVTLPLHPTHEGILDHRLDVVAFAVVLLMSVIIAVHTKVSSMCTLVLVFINMLIVICFVCIGYFHVNHENWTGQPGFFAHGFSGVLNGAATLMFTFTGLEVIASTVEETKEPSRTSSSAIMYSVFITSVVYFCVSTASTLSLHVSGSQNMAVLPEVLQKLNVHGASTVISVGGLLGLLAALGGVCFYIPRLLYALGKDGLILKVFSKESSRGQVSVVNVIVPGILIGVIALLLKVEVLLELVSVGTILAYLMTSLSVICMRYQPGTEHIGLNAEYDSVDDANFMQCTDFTYVNFPIDGSKSKHSVTSTSTKTSCLKEKKFNERSYLNNGFKKCQKSFSYDDKAKLDNMLKQSSANSVGNDNTYTRLNSIVSSTSNGSVSGLLRLPSDIILEPSEQTWRKTKIGLVTYIVLSVALCLTYTFTYSKIASWTLLLIVLIFITLLIIACGVITKQPQNHTKFYFTSPYCPFVPLLSVLVNVFLLGALPLNCWIRFATWTAIGIIFYFCYGVRRSSERQPDDQEVILYEITDDMKPSQ